MKQEKLIKIIAVFTVIAFILIAFIIIKINKLEKGIIKNNLPSTIPPNNQVSNNNIITEGKEMLTIDTNISFTTLSSITFNPQSPLEIFVEKINQSENGIITLEVKVSTEKAETYSSLDLKNYFALVDVENNEFKLPTKIKGFFNSMPPKNLIEGEIIFQNFIKKDKIIIQIGPGDDPKFYEFDFDNKNYKEIQIG